MSQANGIYGYKAIITLRNGVASRMGTSPVDLVRALQSDLVLAGLMVTQFKILGAAGGTLKLYMEIKPSKGYFSTQSVQSIVDRFILQETGARPLWSMDPCCCVVSCSVPCRAGFFAQFGNWVHNAVYGTVSDCQQKQLICNETAGLIKAGADPVAARLQATADVTGSLKVNCALPSQSNFLASPGVKAVTPAAYTILGFAVFAVALVIFAKVK